MADADDFDVEALRALLRGETPKREPAPEPAKKKTQPAARGKKAPAASPKKRPRR